MRLALLLALVLAVPVGAQDAAPARVQIVHNAPDPALAVVDVYLDEARDDALDDVAFRTATPFREVEPGGVVTVAVAPRSSSGVAGALAVGAFVADPGVDYHVVIEGVARPFDFAPNPDGRPTRLEVRVVRRGPARISIGGAPQRIELAFHAGVPDAPAYAYDVRSWTGAGVFGLTARYGDDTLASFSGDDVHYRVRLPGVDEFELTDDNLGVHAGDSALVVFSGFWDPVDNQNGPNLGFFVVREDGRMEAVDLPVFATPAEAGAPDEARALTLGPNPVSDRLAVTLPAPWASRQAQAEVLDVQGRVVLRVPAAPRLSLDASALGPGTYVLRVVDGAEVLARRPFVVVR